MFMEQKMGPKSQKAPARPLSLASRGDYSNIVIIHICTHAMPCHAHGATQSRQTHDQTRLATAQTARPRCAVPTYPQRHRIATCTHLSDLVHTQTICHDSREWHMPRHSDLSRNFTLDSAFQPVQMTPRALSCVVSRSGSRTLSCVECRVLTTVPDENRTHDQALRFLFMHRHR